MKWLLILLSLPLSATLRHYRYDAGRSTKSPYIKNCWPARPSPAKRIYLLHLLRDRLKHEARQKKIENSNEKTFN